MPWKGRQDLGIVALMAVSQPTKGKTRPVFDFREVNGSVECHTGGEVMDRRAVSVSAWGGQLPQALNILANSENYKNELRHFRLRLVFIIFLFWGLCPPHPLFFCHLVKVRIVFIIFIRGPCPPHPPFFLSFG